MYPKKVFEFKVLNLGFCLKIEKRQKKIEIEKGNKSPIEKENKSNRTTMQNRGQKCFLLSLLSNEYRYKIKKTTKFYLILTLQNYQNFIEMTSNMIVIVALGGGFKCPRKIHLNTQCPP